MTDDKITKAYRELSALIDDGMLRMGKTVWTNGEPDVDKWQPIETAPKDKTPVMVFDKNHDNGKMAVAVWENDEHYIIEEQSIPIGIFPTHWMPLLEPPK